MLKYLGCSWIIVTSPSSLDSARKGFAHTLWPPDAAQISLGQRFLFQARRTNIDDNYLNN